MNFMRYGIFFAIVGLFLWAGCADEDALIPIGREEPFLHLPQGNHDYDQQIMELYEKYGVSIFYKFEPKDVYQNWTGGTWNELSQSIKTNESAKPYYYLPGGYTGMPVDDEVVEYYSQYFDFNETQDSVITWQTYSGSGSFYDTLQYAGTYYYGSVMNNGLTSTVTVDSNVYGVPTTMKYTWQTYEYNNNSFLVECADTSNNGEYIKKQLDVLENMLFANYTQEMLGENMPPRIMLGRNLQVGNSVLGIISESYYRANYSIILSYGDASIDTLNGDGLWNLKNGLNVWFLADGMADALYDDIYMNTDFFSYTDYSSLPYATSYRNQSTLVKTHGLCLYNFSDDDKSNIGLPVNSFSVEQKQRLDLRSFIAMAISFPKSYLELDVAPVRDGAGLMAPLLLTDPKGRLSNRSTQDASGKILAKYDIIVDYLTSIGVNVEELANAYWDEQTSYE